jgi:hypothetical protein
MYKNQANLFKNRLYLTLKGKPDVQELQAWSDNLLGEAKKLKNGFGVISDILESQPTTEEGRQIIQTTQRKAKELGMGNVVRITVGANAVTVNQWQRSSRAIGYAALEAGSVAEADKLLDEIEKQVP